MAPKKKDAKKSADPGEDVGLLQSTAFVKKGYPTACESYGLTPLALQLDRGEEGVSPFLHLAVHPGLAGKTKEGLPDPKAPMPTPTHCRALLEALLPYTFLVRLAFWSVPVKDDGCAAIASYLVSNKSLTSLDITDAGVSRNGCKVLGEALERNSTLVTLRLDHNRGVTADGVACLGESLLRNTALSTLSLTYCGLEGPEAAYPIPNGLFRAPMLRVIELKGNRFGADGVLILLGALKACTSVFRVDLADTGWGGEKEVHAALEECFQQNTTCHEYAIGHNPIGDSIIYRWLGMVKRLPHLIFVDVTNRCDPLLFKQIGDACAANKKDWLKRMKKKGGKKGKGGKKKK